MSINVNTSLNDLFENTKATLTELNAGETFIVKSLFRGFEWERIAKGNRTKLGAMFFNYANNEEYGGDNSDNSRRYFLCRS